MRTEVLERRESVSESAVRVAHSSDYRQLVRSTSRSFDHIGLDEAMSVALLSRIDTKVAVPLPQLGAVLGQLAAAPGRPFRVVDTPTGVAPRYTTLYLDTTDLRHYRAHHNGRRVRQKFRYRLYHSTGATFFEVKSRTDANRTSKERVAVSAVPVRPGPSEQALISGLGLRPGALRPRLAVAYDRLTLVGRDRRITIDLGLGCRAVNPSGQVIDDGADFSRFAVLEVKESRRDPRSPVTQALRDHGLRPHAMSKYCLGIAACVGGVRRNRFERRLRLLGVQP